MRLFWGETKPISLWLIREWLVFIAASIWHICNVSRERNSPGNINYCFRLADQRGRFMIDSINQPNAFFVLGFPSSFFCFVQFIQREIDLCLPTSRNFPKPNAHCSVPVPIIHHLYMCTLSRSSAHTQKTKKRIVDISVMCTISWVISLFLPVFQWLCTLFFQAIFFFLLLLPLLPANNRNMIFYFIYFSIDSKTQK